MGLTSIPFGAMKAAGFGFPLSSLTPMQSQSTLTQSGRAPQSHRAEVRTSGHRGGCVEGNELRIRISRTAAVLRRPRLATRLVQPHGDYATFQTARETIGIDSADYLAKQMSGLDTEKLPMDALAALGPLQTVRQTVYARRVRTVSLLARPG